MKAKKKLAVFGDSHTAGSEIEPGFPRNGFCIDKAWGKHLADKLGYSHYNRSAPGAGNQHILENLQNYILSNKSEILSKELDLEVVIMWSTFSRYEIVLPDVNQRIDFGINFSPKYFETKYRKELKEAFDKSMMFFDYRQASFYNISHLYSAKLLLESLDIPFKFIMGIESFLKPESFKTYEKKESSYSESYSLIYNEVKDHVKLGLNDRRETYYNHYRDYTDFKMADWVVTGHFQEDVHKDWANILYNELYEKQEGYTDFRLSTKSK